MGRNRKHLFTNEDFFEKIDFEEKAYFLGLLFADGYHDEKRYSINITLKEPDGYIIKYLSSLILEDSHTYQILNGGKDTCKFSTTSKKISNDLLNHGLIQRKSLILEYPKTIPNDLEVHFIRGYFDGDGCIHIGKNNRFSIVSTQSFLLKVQSILIEKLNLNKVKLLTDKRRENILHTLSYSGNNNLRKIREYLYSNSIIYLKRKFEKFQQL